METQYSSLAELRSALTAEDADERAPAYGSVVGEDLKPSQILKSEPDAEAVEALQKAGVVPETAPSDSRPAADRNEERNELLREIRDLLKDGGA